MQQVNFPDSLIAARMIILPHPGHWMIYGGRMTLEEEAQMACDTVNS